MRLQGESTLSDAEKITEARGRVERLRPRLAELAPNEARFVTEFAERFARYGERTFVSNRQLFWLRDIEDGLL